MRAEKALTEMADSIEKQKKAFIEQIELANEVGKPMMLHIRNNEKAELISLQNILNTSNEF